MPGVIDKIIMGIWRWNEGRQRIAIASTPVSIHPVYTDRQNESSLEMDSGYRHAQEGYGKSDEVHLAVEERFPNH